MALRRTDRFFHLHLLDQCSVRLHVPVRSYFDRARDCAKLLRAAGYTFPTGAVRKQCLPRFFLSNCHVSPHLVTVANPTPDCSMTGGTSEVRHKSATRSSFRPPVWPAPLGGYSRLQLGRWVVLVAIAAGDGCSLLVSNPCRFIFSYMANFWCRGSHHCCCISSPLFHHF